MPNKLFSAKTEHGKDHLAVCLFPLQCIFTQLLLSCSFLTLRLTAYDSYLDKTYKRRVFHVGTTSQSPRPIKWCGGKVTKWQGECCNNFQALDRLSHRFFIKTSCPSCPLPLKGMTWGWFGELFGDLLMWIFCGQLWGTNSPCEVSREQQVGHLTTANSDLRLMATQNSHLPSASKNDEEQLSRLWS